MVRKDRNQILEMVRDQNLLKLSFREQDDQNGRKNIHPERRNSHHSQRRILGLRTEVFSTIYCLNLSLRWNTSSFWAPMQHDSV